MWQISKPHVTGVPLGNYFEPKMIISQIVGICEVCDQKVLYLQCKTKNGLVNKYGMAIHVTGAASNDVSFQ